MGGPAAIQSPAVQQPVPSLADFLVHKLSEFGAMSSAELHDLAAEGGVLPPSEHSGRTVMATLTGSVREERIGQLPDGRFAPLMMSQAIELRRVV